MYICHPVFFPLGDFQNCHKNKQKQGRTSPNRLRITRILMKFSFSLSNLSASCFGIDLFPLLKKKNFFFFFAVRRNGDLPPWETEDYYYDTSLDTTIHLIFPPRSSFHHSNQRRESSVDSSKSPGTR